MKIKQVRDLNVSLGAVLKSLGAKGGLLEIAGEKRYVLFPLNDDLLDYLLERSPKLIKECEEIRARMAAGKFLTHEQVKKRLGA
jgi:hypothetical protein